MRMSRPWSNSRNPTGFIVGNAKGPDRASPTAGSHHPMTLLQNIPLNLRESDILRRVGFGGRRRIRPQIKVLMHELMQEIEACRLLEPSAVYRYFRVEAVSDARTILEGGRILRGSLLPTLFSRAKYLALAVATIGHGIEDLASRYTRDGRVLRGMLLDGMGSAAVDQLARNVHLHVMEKAISMGYRASGAVNPGMPGLPLSEQRPMFQWLSARRIGVKLTSSGIMIPRKSTSMIIGVGSEMPSWTQSTVCKKCNLRSSCPYRVPSGDSDKSDGKV